MLSPRFVAVVSEVFLRLHQLHTASEGDEAAAQAALLRALNVSAQGLGTRRFEPRRPPSTGLLAIALALVHCHHVHLFGFEARREGERSPRCAKYYDLPGRCMTMATYATTGNKYHSWGLQIGTLRVLHKLRLARVVDAV